MKDYLVLLKGRAYPALVKADEKRLDASGKNVFWEFLVNGEPIAVFPKEEVQGITERPARKEETVAERKPVRDRSVHMPRV